MAEILLVGTVIDAVIRAVWTDTDYIYRRPALSKGTGMGEIPGNPFWDLK